MRKIYRQCLYLVLLAPATCLHAMDIQVKDKNIQDFLPWLAIESNHSLLLSPEVDARVSLSLQNINWEDLLSLIANKHDLELSWQGETAILMPKIEIAEIQQEPECHMHYWSIRNAKAEHVSKHLHLLYPNLIVSYDERTNSIISKSCADLLALNDTISWLDSPLKQIEISARIAQVQSSSEHQIGIEWDSTITNSSLSTAAGVVDLGASGANSALSFSVVDNDDLLTLNLHFLETQGLANVVSEPKVVTEEGQTARIESGTEVPYQAVDGDNTYVEFKQAGLTLEVTPYIKVGRRVQLKLKIHQDAVGEMYNGVPSIETNRINTQVVVGDQETLILGGIYRDEIWKTTSEVPFFSKLPIIGALFRKETERQEKVELLVFITPKLLQMSDY